MPTRTARNLRQTVYLLSKQVILLFVALMPSLTTTCAFPALLPAWLDALVLSGGAALRKSFTAAMKKKITQSVVNQIKALRHDGTSESQNAYDQKVKSINDTLVRDRNMNCLLRGLLYEQATTGPTKAQRYKQMIRILRPSSGTLTQGVFESRIRYLETIREWPLLLHGTASHNVMHSKKALARRENDLKMLHEGSTATTKLLLSMITPT